jgi:hypothetical protein
MLQICNNMKILSSLENIEVGFFLLFLRKSTTKNK